MQVTGFLLEDDQGQEFVVVCEKLWTQPEQVFALRSWATAGEPVRHWSVEGMMPGINGLRSPSCIGRTARRSSLLPTAKQSLVPIAVSGIETGGGGGDA